MFETLPLVFVIFSINFLVSLVMSYEKKILQSYIFIHDNLLMDKFFIYVWPAKRSFAFVSKNSVAKPPISGRLLYFFYNFFGNFCQLFPESIHGAGGIKQEINIYWCLCSLSFKLK